METSKNSTPLGRSVSVVPDLPVNTETHGINTNSNATTITAVVPLEQVNKRVYFLGILTFILIASVSIGLWWAQTMQKKSVAPAVITAPQASPLSTDRVGQTVDLPRSEISLHVTNATKISGLAKKTAIALEKLGYPVVRVDNSKSTDNQNVLIINTSYQDKLAILQADLAEQFAITAIETQTLEASIAAKIVLNKN